MMAWRNVVDRWIGTKPIPDPLAPDPETGLVGAVVVTGGSEGIGLEIARVFAANGHHVVLVSRRVEALEAAVQVVRADGPDRAVSMFALDVTEDNASERLANWLSDNGLSCEILVNNAGFSLSGAFVDGDLKRFEQLIELNMIALTRLTKFYLPQMMQRRRGGVLNVASFAGCVPGPYQAVYYASKAYVLSLTEALAWEIRGHGVRIAAVAPGPVETRFHAKMNADSAFYRRLLPSIAAGKVARAGVRGFWSGQTVIIPGILFPMTGLFKRIASRKMQTAATGWLVKPRGDATNAR